MVSRPDKTDACELVCSDQGDRKTRATLSHAANLGSDVANSFLGFQKLAGHLLAFAVT